MSEDGRLQLIVDANIDAMVDKLNRAGSSIAGFSSSTQRQIDSVKAAVDPLGTAFNKMGLEVTKATALLRIGGITAEEHAAAVEHAKLAYDRFAESVNKSSLAEAAEIVVARSRLAVFEEGAAKIPIYGAALEALGPVGLGIAAALAGIGISAEEAKKSLEFAEQIDRLSKSLGVTTTELQAFDYATAGTGVGIDKGREALRAFNDVFGKYSAGLANGKTAKFLDALGFTPESAREVGSTTEALEKALEALSKLQNPQQRAALATQLGLSEFLPVIAEGQEGIEKFTAAMKAAQAAGAIIPPDEIKRGAELNDQLNQIEHTISVEVKEAFIALGPVIIEVAKLIERAAKGAASLAAAFAGIEHANLADASADAQRALDQRNVFYNTGLAGKIDPKTGRATGFGPAAYGYNQNQENYDAANKRIAQLKAEDALPATKTPGANLTPPNKGKEAPTDTFAQDIQKANENIANESKGLAQALAALTTDIDAHAAFEREAVAAERDKTLAKLTAEEASIRAKKGMTDGEKAQIIWQDELAKLLAGDVADAKTAKINRDAITATEAKALQQYLTINGFYDQILQTAIGLARTSAERRVLELQLLAQQKAEGDRRRETARAKEVRDDPDHADAINSYYRSEQASANDKFASNTKKTIKDTEGPISKWKDDTLKSAGEVQQALENATVKGFDAFNSGIADAIANGKSLGDVFKSVFATMEADLIKYLLKQAEIGVLGDATGGIGGFFSGLLGAFGATPAAPKKFATGGLVTGAGGPTSDNIPALLSPGEFVLSNDMLRGLSKMSIPPPSGGGNLTVKVDVTGANGDAAVADIARQAAMEGTAEAIAYTNGRFATASARQRNALGSRR